MSEGFEMPFQWDDGNHFAPVVFTKEEELESIRQIVLEGKCVVTKKSSGDAQQQKGEGEEEKNEFVTKIICKPIQNGEKFIDAGCGNGRVPFYIAKQIYRTSTTKNDDNEPVNNKVSDNIRILGVDIEEDLIAKAKSEAKSGALGFKAEQLDFIHKDLRESVELLASCHFVYCYLLPGDLLTELMMNVTKHWRKSSDEEEKDGEKNSSSTAAPACRVIISNTWDISCLKEFLVGKVGEMWVYSSSSKL